MKHNLTRCPVELPAQCLYLMSMPRFIHRKQYEQSPYLSSPGTSSPSSCILMYASLLCGDDDDPQGAQGSRSSVIAPAQRSDSAKAKARRKRSKDNLPVHSFRTLLKDLATICKNRVQPRIPGAPAFDKITLPTLAQQKALKLLRVKL